MTRLLVLLTALILLTAAGASAAAGEAVDTAAAATVDYGAFLGALVGAGGGLGAILAGALYNARLNRQRDTRLRNQEIRGLCHALAAELIDSAKKLRATAGSVENAVKKQEYLKLEDFKDHYYPVTDIYRANLDKIGLFGELARDVVEVYEHLSVARGDTQEAAKTLKNAEDLARRLEAYDPPED